MIYTTIFYSLYLKYEQNILDSFFITMIKLEL